MSTLKDIIQRALGGEELKVASVETAPVAVVVTASETEKLAESLEYLALNLHAIEAPEAIKAAHFHNFLMKVAEDAVVQQSAMQDALDPTVIPNDYGVDITGGEAAPIPVAMSNTVLPEFVPLVAPPGDMSPTAIPTDDAAPGFIPEADPGKVANYIFQKMAQEEAAEQNLPGYGRGALRGAAIGALAGGIPSAALGAIGGHGLAGSFPEGNFTPVQGALRGGAYTGLPGAAIGAGLGALGSLGVTAIQRKRALNRIAQQEASKVAATFAQNARAQLLAGMQHAGEFDAVPLPAPSADLPMVLSGSTPRRIPDSVLNLPPSGGGGGGGDWRIGGLPAVPGGGGGGGPPSIPGGGGIPTWAKVLGGTALAAGAAYGGKKLYDKYKSNEQAKEAGIGRVYEMLKVASDLDNPANIIAPREEEPGLLLSSPDGLGTPAGGPFLIPEIQSNESVMDAEGLDLTEQFNNELLQYIGENGYDPTTELLLDEAAAQKTASLVKILGVL